MPTRRTPAACCARAASGQATAAPPIIDELPLPHARLLAGLPLADIDRRGATSGTHDGDLRYRGKV